jgi:hypothetical protein
MIELDDALDIIEKLSFGWSKFECLLELRTDSCRLVGPPAEKSIYF